MTNSARGSGFHGREKELTWLRAQFDAVAARAADGKFVGPRMVFIVAESGIGKSRLVQELYLRLTNDPQWDPPEVNYWPDAFREVGAQLRTVPDMRGHVPAGPPRFAWLGARWQPTDVRNVSERRSVLPEIRSSVTTHAEVLKSHGSAWAEAAGRVGEVFRDEGVGAAADAIGIPFFGLLSKVAKSVKDMAADRLAGPKSFDRVEAEEIKSEIDEVLDCMRLLLDGKGAVPTVLWLDDAQWTDAETLEFVRRLWDQAQRRRWPLLIAVTHWEREWRELAQARRNGDAGPSLVDFEGQPSVDTLHLANPANDTLRDYLAQRLPGLKPDQQRLLVDKASGNFLTMVENTGELLSEPMWFVGERIDGALTDDAVAYIREFESERRRRVEQRFKALETEVKQMLGWSAEMGSRFLTNTVIEFARARAVSARPDETLAVCVDPYALVAKPIPEVGEFRDPEYHRVASAYSARFLQRDRPVFLEFIRRQLVVSLEAVAIDSDLPRQFVFESLGSSHSRERRYLQRRSIASLRLFLEVESWRWQRVHLVLTESLRDEIGFAARYLRTVPEGGSVSEARTAFAVRCWLLAEGRPQADGQAESWLAMLESTDWTDEILAPIPAKLLWLWSETVSVSPHCAEAMRVAARKKWVFQFDEASDLGMESNCVESLLDELTECSRWDFFLRTHAKTQESKQQLAELAVRLVKQVPSERVDRPLLRSVSHHALVLAEASLRADLRHGDFSPDELGSMIYLSPESRDDWYDARWAVWLRLCAKRELRNGSEFLHQRVQEAVSAQLGVSADKRDVQDDIDLARLVADCRPHFSQIDYLKLEYALVSLEGNSLERSTEVQRTEIAIGLARAFEAGCDREAAFGWWLKALENWSAASTQGSRWHSSEILSFNSDSSTLARLMIEDASMRTDLKAVVPFIGGVASILDEAVGAAPSDGIELLDFKLIETALRAIGETLGRYESRDPVYKALRNEEELVQLCDELRRRFESDRKTMQ